MAKINAAWLEHWISVKVTELLGREDDFVNSTIFNLLRPEYGECNNVWTFHDAKRIQV